MTTLRRDTTELNHIDDVVGLIKGGRAKSLRPMTRRCGGQSREDDQENRDENIAFTYEMVLQMHAFANRRRSQLPCCQLPFLTPSRRRALPIPNLHPTRYLHLLRKVQVISEPFPSEDLFYRKTRVPICQW
jgi:hypothetical protein